MKKLDIIIVDDNPYFQNALKFMIEETFNEGVGKIDFANNGKEFLDKIEKHYYDIVFMDIVMPEMDGIEATSKACRMFRDITIIALSFNSELKYIMQMLEAGAMNYVLKDNITDEVIGELLTREMNKLPVV